MMQTDDWTWWDLVVMVVTALAVVLGTVMLAGAAEGCPAGKCKYKAGTGEPPPYNTCVPCRHGEDGGTTTTVATTATTATTMPCVDVGLLCDLDGTPRECCAGSHCLDTPGHTICVLNDDGQNDPTTTTTTTVPTSSTGLTPERYGPEHVGLAYYDSSQDVNYHPVTGAWASQYTKAARIDHQLLVELPRVIRALRDLGCGVPSPNTVQDNVGKFLFSYSIRPVASGQPYSYRANYLVDRWRRTVEQFRACLKGDRGVAFLAAHEWARELVGLGVDRVEPLAKVDKSHANDGTLTCRNPFPPLTAAQCVKLHAAHEAHEAHAACLLAHKPAAECEALGAKVRPAQLAFEATARSVAEQQLMLLVFSGDIDPLHSPERVDHYTRQTSAQHHRWASAFRCGTGERPDCLGVLKGRWGHARSHFLRAVKGYYLREVCDVAGRPKANIDGCKLSED